MLVEILSFLILVIFFIVITVDLLPKIRDWFSRIRIGRFGELLVWNKAITEKGARWLVKTPKIKVTDNTRLIIIDILNGHYTKSAIQYWQEASLLLGLSESLHVKNDPHLKETILKYLDSKMDSSGQWKKKPEHVDIAMLAYAIMKLECVDSNKYKKALDYIWVLIRNHVGQDGTVMYRRSMENYRYVDTVGFICPFLITYGIRYENKECIDLALKQIKEYEKHGLHEEHYIPSHAYQIGTKTPLGLYGWGRGLGWFAIGLMDAWNELPNNHKYKLELEHIVKRFAGAVLAFQQQNGSWNWTVTRKESRCDSSATATLGWFLLNAAKISEISNQCKAGSEKAMKFLMTMTKINGEVDFSQGDTKDIGVYSTLFNILPFTQGFCIRTINHYLLLGRDTISKKDVG